MDLAHDNVRLMQYLAKYIAIRNAHFLLALILINYIASKLKRLQKSQSKLTRIPEDILKKLIESRCTKDINLVDYNCCVVVDSGIYNLKCTSWSYICCLGSRRKYKVLIVPLEIGSANLFASETACFNIESTLNTGKHSCYFVVSTARETLEFAKEVRISLVFNSSECTHEMLDLALTNYFSTPRFLRARDVIAIDLRYYASGCFYSNADPKLASINFRVNSVTVNEFNDHSKNGSYALYNETSLIQEANVHSYLPKKFHFILPTAADKFEDCLIDNCPPALKEPMTQLKSCILPFLQKDSQIDIKPIFLVKGPSGCGKSDLIKITADVLGVNLLNVDFSDVQSITSAQTEAKLRIAFKNAENSAPCLLKFNNLQIFGKNAEGQKDERLISTFVIEVNNLLNRKMKYPVIVVATCDSSDVPAELKRIFVENIEIGHPSQADREETLSWLLANKAIQYNDDLYKVAVLCSDFTLSDLKALVLNASKHLYKLNEEQHNELPSMMTLRQDNFISACESMQSVLSDRIGAPRVPKVQWEDIGGLANLKKEIISRIELPLLNPEIFGRSGIILFGPPGTGKTLLAKAVATECQLHFLSVKGPELLNMYVGQSEKNVRTVFEKARAAAPCVIFFDELDALAPNRGRSGDSGGVMDRVVSSLLAEMDGLESAASVFIIGATNRPDLIDPALLRPGRFDKMLYVGLHSDNSSKLSVLKAITRKFKLQQRGQELEQVVSRLYGELSGADLYSVCFDAWMSAMRRTIVTLNEFEDQTLKQEFYNKITASNGIEVELNDFEVAIQSFNPSLSYDERLRYEKLRNELSA